NNKTLKCHIPGYQLVVSQHHPKHGLAMFMRQELWNICSMDLNSSTPHAITTRIGEVMITNIYKPPNVAWPKLVLPNYSHPSIWVGDFSSHHTTWGYDNNDAVGEQLLEWASNQDKYLLFDSKQPGTFHSTRWRKDYSPDLCFVSCDQNARPLVAEQTMLDDFLYSQHCPAVIPIGPQVPLITLLPKPHWNFRKADWNGYMETIEKVVQRISANVANYNRFINLFKVAVKTNIPHGYRKAYTPCWSVDSEALLKEFRTTGNPAAATALLESLNSTRKAMQSLDFTHSSRKAWKLFHNLGSANPPQSRVLYVTVDAIATQILLNSKAHTDCHHKWKVKKEIQHSLSDCPATSCLSKPFTREEVDKALALTKPQKATGPDGIFPEFLKNLGQHAHDRLTCFLTNSI
uniref:Endonuclease/exonuclease/phosphatase domain-containing protein n=1 Tax=Latimeria chalumnae TaxID=7897 RepID=H3A7T0_LATCH